VNEARFLRLLFALCAATPSTTMAIGCDDQEAPRSGKFDVKGHVQRYAILVA
jgi:hypothetical protein